MHCQSCRSCRRHPDLDPSRIEELPKELQRIEAKRGLMGPAGARPLGCRQRRPSRHPRFPSLGPTSSLRSTPARRALGPHRDGARYMERSHWRHSVCSRSWSIQSQTETAQVRPSPPVRDVSKAKGRGQRGGPKRNRAETPASQACRCIRQPAGLHQGADGHSALKTSDQHGSQLE